MDNTREYRNIFSEIGLTEEQVTDRINGIFNTMFYGSEDERLYHEAGDHMGYIEDTGNHDVRTEGMSYGMMICVQLDKKDEFDCLWKWVMSHMLLDRGPDAGYFAWSCAADGKKNAYGPAPDGEEFFAMALFFASRRWGNGEGIFDYSKEARRILRECLHKGEDGQPGFPMWEHSNHLIKFIPECDWSDPSYHIPHFYELFALWSDEEDRPFWRMAAEASRKYLKKACDSSTGLSPEYAEYDGTPWRRNDMRFGGRHDWFYSDAYRTAANIALDHSWFGKDRWEKDEAEKIQKFFCETVKNNDRGIYDPDGTVIEGKALHPVGLMATIAQASLASDGKYAARCVKQLWETPLRNGSRRYYDNCLYMFAYLALSGNYRIW